MRTEVGRFSQLEVLEQQVDRFNIFEVLGAVRVELRHSEFLAYLLDPIQNHGLDDLFTRRFLQAALTGAQSESIPVRPIDLALWDFELVELRREWQNIDILLIDEKHKFVVIIENKLFSNEHSSQLERYWKIVTREFPGWSVLGTFLSPEGLAPSEEQSHPSKYRVGNRSRSRVYSPEVVGDGSTA